jgi:hypothetical protein
MGWPTDPEEYDGERLFGFGPETEIPEPKPVPEISPEQRILDWLQRWPKETVSMRDVQQFGPKMIRKQQGVINSAIEVLVRHRWLTPVPTRQNNMREWQITRKQIVYPTVAPPTAISPTVAP